MLGLLDAVVFSGGWVALAAAALAAAVSLGFGSAPDARVVLLAFAGTFAVYGADRVRDRDRDAARAPVRSAFIERRRRPLAALAVASALVATGLALALGPAAVALSCAAGGIGLLHRRLKERVLFKAGYVTAVWVVVVVGLPAIAARPAASDVAWAGALLGPALLANAIAFNVRDEEALVRFLGPRRALAIATGWASLGLGLAAFAPRALQPLAAVALATLVSLLGFRRGERYAHVAVDGALLVGALVACSVG